MPRIFQTSLIVGPESIDAVGHVNNREYLRWMEEIAVQHSAAHGWPMERYLTDGTAWFAASHFIEYLRPSHLGDALEIFTWVARWDGRDCLRRYSVTRDRKILARGETAWAFVDLATGRARVAPPAVVDAFCVVGEDDSELRELGLAKRPRRGGSGALPSDAGA